MILVLKACERELEEFPMKVRRDLNELLFRLDKGKSFGMPVSRPMPSIGHRVHEFRLGDESGQYRIIYWIKEHGKIILLHAFKKTTQATARHELLVAKMRLRGFL